MRLTRATKKPQYRVDGGRVTHIRFSGESGVCRGQWPGWEEAYITVNDVLRRTGVSSTIRRRVTCGAIAYEQDFEKSIFLF